MGDPRPLSGEEAELLLRLLRSDAPGVEALREQVAVTSVKSPWSPGSASLELSVSGGATPSAHGDGPVPGNAWVYDSSGQALGTLLLWVAGGYLSAIEYGWVTDEAPARLPAAAAVRDED